jgi:FixJ family two-component response regulator/CBS domain-containing protein
MSRELVSLPPHAFAYEAALEMTERRIRHILVTEGGRLVGVVSERDLFALQRLGMGELTMEIRLADGIATLSGLAVQIRSLAALLVEQGTAPEPLTLFISVLNDRLTRRIIEVVRRRHELDRVRWTWLAFGSEGRFEQTFSTDQDNGLLFAAPEDMATEGVRGRLIGFAREVNEALDACGFPLCEGNIMASNLELCLTLEEWQAKMSAWLEVTRPQALLDAAICLDLRPIHGDEVLAAGLRDWITERVRGHAAFLRLLAQAATQSRPALGRFARSAAVGQPEGQWRAHLCRRSARAGAGRGRAADEYRGALARLPRRARAAPRRNRCTGRRLLFHPGAATARAGRAARSAPRRARGGRRSGQPDRSRPAERLRADLPQGVVAARAAAARAARARLPPMSDGRNEGHEPGQRPPTAYVVDDDESIRTLWRWLLESNGIAVQTFATAKDFIEAYRHGGPGCLVLDLRLPGMSGLELQEYLRQREIAIPIVFVTGHGDVPSAVHAIKGGAVDFIEKPFGYKEVVQIIRRALERDAQLRERRARRSEYEERFATLTEREREVMLRVIEGKLNKVIADELEISVKTVEFHRAKVMEKMGVSSVASLVQLRMQYPE